MATPAWSPATFVCLKLRRPERRCTEIKSWCRRPCLGLSLPMMHEQQGPHFSFESHRAAAWRFLRIGTFEGVSNRAPKNLLKTPAWSSTPDHQRKSPKVCAGGVVVVGVVESPSHQKTRSVFFNKYPTSIFLQYVGGWLWSLMGPVVERGSIIQYHET